jgi:hypothetical protein
LEERTVIPECQHTLYNGRQCRRIPATGQRFCPAHRRRRRREDDAFDREMDAYSDSLAQMNLAETLAALEAALVDVRPRIPRSARNEFFRAGICVGFALQRLEESRKLRSPSAPSRSLPDEPSHLMNQEELGNYIQSLVESIS